MLKCRCRPMLSLNVSSCSSCSWRTCWWYWWICWFDNSAVGSGGALSGVSVYREGKSAARLVSCSASGRDSAEGLSRKRTDLGEGFAAAVGGRTFRLDSREED